MEEPFDLFDGEVHYVPIAKSERRCDVPKVDLEELERLEKAATPGPWTPRSTRDSGYSSGSGPPHGPSWEVDDDEMQALASKDALLIARSRNVLPALIAELRALRAVACDARSLLGSLAYSAPENMPHVLETRGESLRRALDEADVVGGGG